jgi:hypothetical protein
MRTNSNSNAAERTERQASRQAVMKALMLALANAPEFQRNVLAQALEEYGKTYHRSYNDMRKGGGFMADLLDTIEQATECRIPYEE